MTAPAPADTAADTAAEVAPAATVTGVGLLPRLAQSEPVRLYLYALAAAVLAALVGYGVLTGEQAALWAGVAAAALAVPVTEGLRSQVVSPRTAAQLAAR
jgi:hypothetical protein